MRAVEAGRRHSTARGDETGEKVKRRGEGRGKKTSRQRKRQSTDERKQGGDTALRGEMKRERTRKGWKGRERQENKPTSNKGNAEHGTRHQF